MFEVQEMIVTLSRYFLLNCSRHLLSAIEGSDADDKSWDTA